MHRAAPLPPEQRRAALIAATEPLLERHGRQVSTRQIAEAAGVAEGTIFRVFASKDELVDAVVADVFDGSAVLAELAAVDLGLPLEERLERAIAVLQRRLRRVVRMFHALDLGDNRRPPAAKAGGRAEHEQRVRAELSRLLEPDAGRLRTPVAEAAALVHAVAFAAAHPLLGEHDAPTARHLVDLVLHGVLDRREASPC